MQHFNRRRYRRALWMAYAILAGEHLLAITVFIHVIFAVSLPWKIAMSAAVIGLAFYETHRTSKKYVLRQHRKEHLTKLYHKIYEKRRQEKKQSAKTTRRPAA